MKNILKLNTVLALTQSGKAAFQQAISNYTKFFKGEQGAFKGFKNTYEPNPGTVDDNSKRGFVKVVSTVDEKIGYMKQHNSPFITMVMDQEATNASGAAKAELVVGDKSWGVFSSGELLRLKGLVENADFKTMIANIPVRSDSEIWTKSNAEAEGYDKRAVFEKEIIKNINKTLKKEEYILKDPNINEHNAAKYTPVKSSVDTVIELGLMTAQEFSGAWSHSQRAYTLARLDVLKASITKALAEANDVTVVQSNLDGDKFFDFVFAGTNDAIASAE